MHITIKYWVQWNYTPQAASLADAIKDKFGVECEMIQGGGGIFDVTVDGDLIYSKLQTGRFPEHEEVFTAIAQVQTSKA